MSEDLGALPEAEIEARISELRARMQPLEAEVQEIRAQRDQLLTELRRRERLARMQSRAGIKAAMKAGQLLSLTELIEQADAGSFDDYTFNLRTGGEVRLGFPGARTQSLAFSDGRQLAQARDLAEAARYQSAGWELGTPGRPGVRVHFPGTRQERLAPADDVFARVRDPASEGNIS